MPLIVSTTYLFLYGFVHYADWSDTTRQTTPMTANTHCFMAAPRCFGDLSASAAAATIMEPAPASIRAGLRIAHPNAGDDCQQEVIHTLVVGEESSYSQLFD